jgi:multiple sugar transport system substrate-binding protein
MMQSKLSRRGILKAGAAFGAASLVGAGPAFAEDKRVRMYFWGSKDRADRTLKVNDLYAGKNADTKIEAQFAGWGDYWAPMATQAAARNLPDIIQMDYRYIFEYARRGALMPLDAFMGKELDIADFGDNSINCGKVDNKLYGINLGNNSMALMLNLDAWTKAGVPAPKSGTTWKEFAELCAAFSKASGGVAGTSDVGGGEVQLECYLRQHGKALYTADGKAGYEADDIAAWFDYWDQMRKSGACVTPDVQALNKDTIDTDAITLGKAAIGFAHSNQLVGYQALIKSKIGIAMYPSGEKGADKPGQYLKPSMFFSVAANSKLGSDAAKIINYFVKDPDAVKALSVERGVPASAASRGVLGPMLDELGQTMVSYISEVTGKVGPLPPPPPKGAGEIQSVLRRYNEQVAFGKLKVKDAARGLYDEVTGILDRG